MLEGFLFYSHRKNAFTAMKSVFLNDKFILLIIFVNAIAMFLQGFAPSEPIYSSLIAIDNACTILFLIEAFVKISTSGFSKYWLDGWNKLDFLLVIFSLPALLIWLGFEHVGHLHIFMVLRMLRVFKFFRLLKFIPDVEHLIRGFKRAIKSSLVVVLAFLIFNFIIGMLSFTFFHNILPESFGNPALAFYSTFKVFTVEGWYEIPDQIAENSTPTIAFFSRLYFVLLLAIGGIIGLSLVNSVFVDSMISDNTDGLEKHLQALEKKIENLTEKIEKKLE